MRDRLFLAGEERLAETVPTADKDSLGEAHQLGRQRLLAVERLWLGGCAAEALKLASTTLDSLRAATKAHGRSLPESERVAADLARVGLPTLDGNVTKEQRATFAPLVQGLRVELETLGALAATPAELRVRRGRRVVGLAAVLLVAIGLAVLALRPRPRMVARASATRPRDATETVDGMDFGQDNAVDGEPSTEWLLPDGRQGHLDVRLIPPRATHRVRLLPSHGTAYTTGGGKARPFTVELWNGGTLVRTIDGDFGPPQTVPLWKSLDVETTRVDLVRVVLQEDDYSFHGLAEVEVE